jgi:hypothetical protein
MDLSLFEIRSPYLLKTAQSLPAGKLLSTGKGLVGNIRQSLYSDLVEDVAVEPLAIPRGKVNGPLPVIKGPAESWDTIGVGHVVVAQESLDWGWAEAVVLDRTDDILTLRFQYSPKTPKLYRHYRAVALLSQPTG